jgi:hypothetical protein
MQIAGFRFPEDLSTILGVARIHVPEIAARCGVSVETRQDPELGPVYGFALRLPSGRTIVVEEWEYDIQEHRSEGPYISTATELVASGAADAIFGEAVQVLMLDDSEIGWAPPANARLEAKLWLEKRQNK